MIVPINSVENIQQLTGIKILHVFDPGHNHGGVTIVWSRCEEYRNSRMVEVAVAYCHPQDKYVRKTGARMAIDRWLNGNTVVVPAGDASNQVVSYNLQKMFWACLN